MVHWFAGSGTGVHLHKGPLLENGPLVDGTLYLVPYRSGCVFFVPSERPLWQLVPVRLDRNARMGVGLGWEVWTFHFRRDFDPEFPDRLGAIGQGQFAQFSARRDRDQIRQSSWKHIFYKLIFWRYEVHKVKFKQKSRLQIVQNGAGTSLEKLCYSQSNEDKRAHFKHMFNRWLLILTF